MDFLPRQNQPIDVKVLFGNHAGTYKSYVEEVSERGIVVAAPSKSGFPIPLGPGHAVRLEFVATGAKVAFNTRITAVMDHGVPVIRVAIPDRDQVERQQLRNFVRIDASMNVAYKWVTGPDAEENPRPQTLIRSRTKDISAGGAQILCPEPYPNGTRLDVTLDLGGTQLRALCEVKRVFPPNEDNTHWTALQFVDLGEREQDLVIRHIFSLQREMRKKGLM